MDSLIRQLLLDEDEDQRALALKIVGTLVQLESSQKYFLAISASVAKIVACVKPHETLQISNELLQVWIHLMATTDQVSVHSNLLAALPTSSPLLGPVVLLEPAMDQLVEIWKLQLKEQTSASSIVAVRCATCMMQCIIKLGDVAYHVCAKKGATDLLLQMLLSAENDPLLQLSILDLMVQECSSSATAPLQVATRDWLTSTSWTQPVIQLLQDPLLGGAAMQYLAMTCTLGVEDADRIAPVQTALFQYIGEVGATTSESDRLPIVQALSQIATSSPQTVLEDPQLRHAW
jgi:hypothetical protein